MLEILRPENMVAAGVAIIAFAAIVTLAAPLMGTNRLEGRMKSVANRREELRRRSREAIASNRAGAGMLRHSDEGLLKTVVERLQLRRLLEDPKVVEKLAQAGYRGPKPVTRFYFFRLVGPFILAGFAAMYLFVIGVPMPGNLKLVAVVAAFVGGFYAPNLYVTNQVSKRLNSIVQAWPDALDLLLICVESGMSVEAAIHKVSAEIGGRSIELAEEMTLLGAELSYLPERRLAYEGMAKRIPYPGVKAVMTAMIQAERYGTPLGSALRVMAKENRELRLTSAEKKAAALPAKLTVPMIMFLLPVLFAVILGPAILNAMDMGGLG